ncbi:uncharacterized protein LOC141843998 [Curcuma longa]|uniref:uncharacterized protein LOC141843998 n=1 Tax=Curcuma longa TaxID=136217 RepID=UPI003D9E7BAD
MSTVEGGERDVDSAKIPTEHPLPPHPPPYATFLPQPVPPMAAPPNAYAPAPPPNAPPPHHPATQPGTGHHHIAVGYQPQPYSAVVNGMSVNTKEPPLPCCGIGIGWALFVAGFFFAAIPWYVGALLLLFVDQDYREKCGLVACSIAAGLAFLSVIINALNSFIFCQIVVGLRVCRLYPSVLPSGSPSDWGLPPLPSALPEISQPKEGLPSGCWPEELLPATRFPCHDRRSYCYRDRG